MVNARVECEHVEANIIHSFGCRGTRAKALWATRDRIVPMDTGGDCGGKRHGGQPHKPAWRDGAAHWVAAGSCVGRQPNIKQLSSQQSSGETKSGYRSRPDHKKCTAFDNLPVARFGAIRDTGRVTDPETSAHFLNPSYLRAMKK